ncbi:glycosyltransferase [Sphingomonas morindae]|uniref:Glycosyltransferase n=1 Tax=Sphingomonas morindae TaxID=1541170 RepID=A0ABY4X446_9SPHN|nr:glycosyltransferase [Sphingomonas morindae]USI71664.1 glycosyltransferase [Sphingomonas morindae]
MIWAALASLLIWAYLLLARDGFWLADQTDRAVPPPPRVWPAVTAVVPARDEADVIAASIGALLAQDYPGPYQVVLVDDGSSDGTAAIAAALPGAARLRIVAGTPPPRGWTGKLWAMANGITAAGAAPRWLWFTDADIAHAPDMLTSLVARAEADGLAMHSLMARLECRALAERALIPAFVFFFQMLYPFRRVNRPAARMAAAAGGCMLIRRDLLARAGGVGAIAHAIIDDCAMGALMKKEGPIRLALTDRAVSIRPYGGWRAIGAMIARSAYAQLRYSPLLLLLTLCGMALVYCVPPLAVLAGGWTSLAGLAAWALMAVSFVPMARFYGRSPFWGVALPAIGLFYAGATLISALRHWQGRGGMWKGRAQAGLERVEP